MVESKKKRRKRKGKKKTVRLKGFAWVIITIGVILFSFWGITKLQEKKKEEPIDFAGDVFPELNITKDYLTPNPYSRPELPLKKVKYIVIHYVGNPNTTAKANRDYFDSLKDSQSVYASSHFVIGLEGEIIQCIPLNEESYASNKRNVDSISIEMCHPDDTGAFNDATYNASVYLTAKLCNYYHIDRDHVIRHYDVTGKICPKYFVEHEDRWEVFRDFVEEYKNKYKKEGNIRWKK